MDYQRQAIKSVLNKILKVVRTYEWLLDLYVLDFFVENHWEKLPRSWRHTFQHIDPKDLSDILLGMPTKHILPLSLLALRNTVQSLSLRRRSTFETIKNDESICKTYPKLKNLFLKHVKLKKRFEIDLMADMVSAVAVKSQCNSVVDFGSGLGHLVRVLAYKYNLNAAGIESQIQLTEEARKLDLELEFTASKHLSPETILQLHRPLHFNITLTSEEQLSNLPLPNTMKHYGLIGLHPCGNLGPILLKHFIKSDHVKFVCLVGCCHMKLTNDGYPMSGYLKSLDSNISYTSKEIACHAIEVYLERLQKGNYEDLKVHAYRAALERILVEHDPKLRHAPVRSIKHSDTMTFERYCTLAVEKLNLQLPSTSSVWSRGDHDLRQWQRVVTVYTLRLALAPLVETLILLDRVLYVLEHDLCCEIHPVFDPKISPRNHIIVARRS